MTEKSSIANKIYALCFLGLMMLFGIASVALFISNNFLSETETLSSSGVISFLQQYPFTEDAQNLSAETAETSAVSSKKVSFSFIEDYRNLANSATNKTEQYLTTLNPLSSPFKRFISTVSGEIVMLDSSAIIKLPNGHLAECLSYCPSHESWDSILDFSLWLEEKDIPFVSLITPDKSDDSITVFPAGVSHGYTQMLDEYKAFMDENEIAYIETKKLLLAENDDLYAWFYRSDHHWNVHAAFLTASKTAEYLSDTLSVPADTSTLNDENFTLAIYPDSFLGSYGKKIADTQKEAMEVFYPKAETSFHIEIPGYDIDKTGAFEDTLIVQNRLDAVDTSYAAFLYESRPLIRIENNFCKNGTKVLMIIRSFANSLCPYLANTVQYLDVIDPRYFDGSIRSYIEQTNPDVVILCMGVAIEGYEDCLRLR